MKKYEQKTCANCGQKRKIVRGEWLRWKRERLGIGLRSLARRLNYTPAYISDIELGKRNGTPKIWAAYEALNFSDSNLEIGRARQ